MAAPSTSPTTEPSSPPADSDAGEERAVSGASRSALERLVADVKLLAEAETVYYKTKLSLSLSIAKRAMVLFAIGIVLALLAIIALILGILLSLAPLVTPAGATAIVVLASLIGGLISIKLAVSTARTMPLGSDGGNGKNG